ncbi:hypothetical protein BH11CYA1_BH11CYA1_43380 [soil metagenome]
MSLEASDSQPKHKSIDRPAEGSDNTKSAVHDQVNGLPAKDQLPAKQDVVSDNAAIAKMGFPTPLITDSTFGLKGSLFMNDADRKLLDGPKKDLESHLGDTLTDRVVKTVASNEGKFTTLTLNDAGHGISVGVRQWNQKKGELPDLLKSFHDKNPEKFDNIFGKYADNLLSEKYVRRTNLAGNKDLMGKMKEALKDPEFQEVQVDKFKKFAEKSGETAKKYGLKSELGAALVADIANQMGEGGARRIMRRAGLTPGGEVADEAAALKKMEKLTHRPNSKARFDSLASSFSSEKDSRKKLETPGRRQEPSPSTYVADLDLSSSNVA